MEVCLPSSPSVRGLLFPTPGHAKHPDWDPQAHGGIDHSCQMCSREPQEWVSLLAAGIPHEYPVRGGLTWHRRRLAVTRLASSPGQKTPDLETGRLKESISILCKRV